MEQMSSPCDSPQSSIHLVARESTRWLRQHCLSRSSPSQVPVDRGTLAAFLKVTSTVLGYGRRCCFEKERESRAFCQSGPRRWLDRRPDLWTILESKSKLLVWHRPRDIGRCVGRRFAADAGVDCQSVALESLVASFDAHFGEQEVSLVEDGMDCEQAHTMNGLRFGRQRASERVMITRMEGPQLYSFISVLLKPTTLSFSIPDTLCRSLHSWECK